MRLLRTLILCGIAVTVVSVELPSACADGYGYGYYWGGYGYPFGAHAYRSGNIPTPPYFAIHPPVYYGKRVGMPYGNSPFPRPARAVVRVSPQRVKYKPRPGVMIVNPYVKNDAEAKGNGSSPKAASSKPKAILNPYVVADEKVEPVQFVAD